MTPTKGDVKHWLKAIGKNRDWLAMECGTEKGTVNNWLSPSGPFPASAMLKIQSLMSQYKTVRPEDEPVQTNRLVLEITEERMRKYERAASEKGVPLLGLQARFEALLQEFQLSGGLGGQASDIEIHARELLKLKDKLNRLLAQHCGRDLADLERDTDRDNYMSAEEARVYGLIDQVLETRDSIKAD